MRRTFAATLIYLRTLITGQQALAFFPAASLGAYWLGGEAALIALAIGIPAALAIITGVSLPISTENDIDGLTCLPLRSRAIDAMDKTLGAQATTGRTSACFAIEIDNYIGLEANFGTTAVEEILRTSSRRLTEVVRDFDIVSRLDGPRFAIALAPIRRADLETLIQMSSRIQAALSEPLSINATKVYISVCIGFCLPSRAPSQSGTAFLSAAESALTDARFHGAGSIRAFTPGTAQSALDRELINSEVGDALENGQIVPWFQPQISTDTGTVSGMEALARWVHPNNGIILPAEFIPAIEENGLIERLGEIILYHAFTALKTWDKAGFEVPTIAVNFSATELANPKLVDKIRWEFDRFELEPSRLTVEILENVIASSDNDTITRNIAALSQLGCGIDLDDFGTGHASISNVRRFAVKRIKIDKSYVTRCDVDREQQDMLAAILTMAERINLDTLTEGVETVGEHAMLAQLGCGHVQGFSIARPMAFDFTLDWMDGHRQKMAETPQIGRRAS
jgi:diguanylate cyclase (GGDEF)-like protein